MPRQQKPGLSYFPLDVDFFTDNKIRILRARFGNNGIAVYIYLLCEIYKKGYYMEWNDDFKFILAADLNLSDGFIEQVLTFLLERSLLDSTLFKSDTILTSPGIQRRYQLAVKERAKKTPVVIKGFWLLEADETEPFIKVNPSFHSSRKNEDNSRKNNDTSRKNDIKKSKEKKSKEKEIKVNKESGVAAGAATLFSPDSFEMLCVNTLIHSCLEGFREPGSRQRMKKGPSGVSTLNGCSALTTGQRSRSAPHWSMLSQTSSGRQTSGAPRSSGKSLKLFICSRSQEGQRQGQPMIRQNGSGGGQRMDKREFAALAAAMEEYYGRNQITKSAASMDIWYELIGDIPYGQCKNAVRQLMATNNFFPSAAEIRKLCTQTGDPEAPSIDDAWGMVLKAVRAYGYMQEAEALESLPEPCRSVVKNIGCRTSAGARTSWQSVHSSVIPMVLSSRR